MLQGLCQAINPALSQSPAELSLSRVVRMAQEKVRLAERQRMSQVFTLAADGPKVADFLKSPLADTAAGAPPASIGLSTAPSASTVSPGQAGPEPSATVADPASSSIPEKIIQWARAVASSPDRHSGLEFLSNGELRVSKQVLNFGATARETYKSLFDAGLVVRKGESDAVVKPELAAIFRTAMGAVNAKV
ncbi:hypothetical protein LP417_35305 (plasmid) [Polaromonas sp. P1-6]|nr:hypothetical protein LP417_35305 [Polaromonas sp. P1-6]